MKVSFTPAISTNLYKKPISFKSNEKEIGDIVEFSHTEKKGLFGKQIEKTTYYDPKTGGMTNITVDTKDNQTDRTEFYPQKGMQVSTTIDKNGIATITTKTALSTKIEKLDAQNRRIYTEQTDSQGGKRVETTDYERGRSVITTSLNGSEIQTIVIDLKTGMPQIDGDLVIDTRYDETTGTFITENIVTKAKHKEVKRNEKGQIISEKEFNPETGKVKVERQFNRDGAGLLEDVYTGEVDNKIVSTLFVSSDEKERDEVFFEEDGKTIKSHTFYTFRRNGQKETESEFDPNGNLIKKIEYRKNGSRCTDIFDAKTGNRTFRKVHNENDGLVCETIYYKDGTTRQFERRINKKGEISVSSYDKLGVESQRKYLGPDMKPVFIEFFNPKTNTLQKTIEYDRENNQRIITEYDVEEDAPYKETITDMNGQPIECTIFHQDGETPLYSREFYNDGSYLDTEYDVYGEPVKSIKYTKDGEKKY